MNYLALRAAIIDWTEEDGAELAAHIDDFIRFAELRLFRDIDLEIYRTHLTSLLNVGDPYVTLPAGTDIIIRDFHLIDRANQRQFLLRKHNSFIYDFWPDNTQLGQPRFYSRWLYNVLLLAPTPDYAYQLDLEISQLPTSIVPVAGQTNANSWLGDNAWDALLASAMVEAISFMKADADYQAAAPTGVWQQKYQEALDRLGTQEKRERLDDYRRTDPQ